MFETRDGLSSPETSNHNVPYMVRGVNFPKEGFDSLSVPAVLYPAQSAQSSYRGGIRRRPG
jgi:hypothetical protein